MNKLFLSIIHFLSLLVVLPSEISGQSGSIFIRPIEDNDSLIEKQFEEYLNTALIQPKDPVPVIDSQLYKVNYISECELHMGNLPPFHCFKNLKRVNDTVSLQGVSLEFTSPIVSFILNNHGDHEIFNYDLKANSLLRVLNYNGNAYTTIETYDNGKYMFITEHFRKPNTKYLEGIGINYYLEIDTQSSLEDIRSNFENIEQMPYICEGQFTVGKFGCGDALFWEVVTQKDEAIPYLIELLGDTTSTKVYFPNYGGIMTVADIAQIALGELIQPLPTPNSFFEIEKMNDSQWMANIHWLQTSFENRLAYQSSIANWYSENKSNLVWTSSNTFMCGDLAGEHPNKGHYQLKSD